MSTEDISLLHPLYLVHPWIDFLLDRQSVGGCITDAIAEERGEGPFSLAGVAPPPGRDDVELAPLEAKKMRLDRFFIPLKRVFGTRPAPTAQDAVSLQSPLLMSERHAVDPLEAQRLVARLKQPFGALFTQIRLNAPEYRRVTVDTVITVQVQDNRSELQELFAC